MGLGLLSIYLNLKWKQNDFLKHIVIIYEMVKCKLIRWHGNTDCARNAHIFFLLTEDPFWPRKNPAMILQLKWHFYFVKLTFQETPANNTLYMSHCVSPWGTQCRGRDVFVFETQRDRERAREGFVNLSQLALELKRCWELANITEFQKSPLGGHEHLTSAFKLCSEETPATHQGFSWVKMGLRCSKKKCARCARSLCYHVTW